MAPKLYIKHKGSKTRNIGKPKEDIKIRNKVSNAQKTETNPETTGEVPQSPGEVRDKVLNEIKRFCVIRQSSLRSASAVDICRFDSVHGDGIDSGPNLNFEKLPSRLNDFVGTGVGWR